jgi:hypothetical protein
MKLGPATGVHPSEVIRMRIIKRSMLMLLAVGLLLVPVLSNAQSSPTPLGIVPSPSPSNLIVNIWTDKQTYAVGENALIYFTVNQQAFIYIYDLQPDGVVRMVFPNAYSQNNYVSAGTHVLPDTNYKFLITPPTGLEKLQIFASLAPLNLTPSSYNEPYPQTSPQCIQGQIMGITPQATWATAWTSFTITSTAYSYTPPCYNGYVYPPFFGCCPGVNWYWSNGQWCQGTPPSGWYWYYGPDGKWHFTIRIHVGGN